MKSRRGGRGGGMSKQSMAITYGALRLKAQIQPGFRHASIYAFGQEKGNRLICLFSQHIQMGKHV